MIMLSSLIVNSLASTTLKNLTKPNLFPLLSLLAGIITSSISPHSLNIAYISFAPKSSGNSEKKKVVVLCSSATSLLLPPLSFHTWFPDFMFLLFLTCFHSACADLGLLYMVDDEDAAF